MTDAALPLLLPTVAVAQPGVGALVGALVVGAAVGLLLGAEGLDVGLTVTPQGPSLTFWTP